MAVFDKARSLAKRLIEEKGELITVRKYNSPTNDPAKPWKPGTPATTYTEMSARAVFLNFKLSDRTPLQYADGTQVRIGDKRVLMAALDLTFDPDLNNLLLRSDGSGWLVRQVDLLDPNGEKVLFELWVSR